MEAGAGAAGTNERGGVNSPRRGAPRAWRARAKGTTCRGSAGFTAKGREEGSASSANWVGGGVGGRAAGATGRGGMDEGEGGAFFLP